MSWSGIKGSLHYPSRSGRHGTGGACVGVVSNHDSRVCVPTVAEVFAGGGYTGFAPCREPAAADVDHDHETPGLRGWGHRPEDMDLQAAGTGVGPLEAEQIRAAILVVVADREREIGRRVRLTDRGTRLQQERLVITRPTQNVNLQLTRPSIRPLQTEQIRPTILVVIPHRELEIGRRVRLTDRGTRLQQERLVITRPTQNVNLQLTRPSIRPLQTEQIRPTILVVIPHRELEIGRRVRLTDRGTRLQQERLVITRPAQNVNLQLTRPSIRPLQTEQIRPTILVVIPHRELEIGRRVRLTDRGTRL